MRGGERDPRLPARATSVRLEDEIVRVAAVFGHFYRPFSSAIFIERFYRSARGRGDRWARSVFLRRESIGRRNVTKVIEARKSSISLARDN